MAAKSSAEVAICRLVEETREGETLLRRDFLGLGCLAKFESVKFLRSLGKPKSNFFLVASKRAVLTKSHLMAIKKPRKDGKEISVKVVAEFLGTEDSKLLERRDLSDLCRSLKKDVYDLNGVTYVALTNQKGSSFLRSRFLEVYNFSQGGDSSVLRDELQCLVFRKETVSETTQQERTAAFSTQIYDLFHGNRDLATGGVDSPFVGVDFSTSASRRRFLKEDEFEKGDMPLGAVIVTKDGQLAGFLDFYNKHPVPLLFGSNFQETGDTMTHTGEESQGGASGGVSHMSYQSQLAGLRSRALDCLASENSAAGEMALPQQNVESYGDGDLQNNKSQGPFPTENSCRHVAAHLPSKDGNIESELSVGAAGCIYPPVESHILADSHISASGGSDDKSHPGGTAQPGEIKCTLDEKVAAAAQNDTDTYSSEFQFSGRNSNEHLPEEGNSQAVEQGETISELPVGAADAGGIYLPVDSDSLAGCNISVSGGDGKSNPGSNTQLQAMKHNLDNKAAAAAAERETNTDPSEVCMNGRSSNEVLAEEENSWAVGQGDTMTHTGEESQGGASGGVSHMSYQSQLAGLRSRALDCLASENSAAGEMALQQQNVESYGDGDLQNNKSQGPFPTENSCRHMAAHLPPKDGNIESELSVGAAGCIYPPVESHILADSHISASGGSDDKSHPGGTAQPGEIKCTLDDKVAAAAQNDTDTYSSEFQFSGRNSNEHLPEEGNSQAVEQGETISELPVGAADAGGIYLPVDSDSLAGCNISVSGGDGKSKPSGNTQPRAIKHNLDNKAAAAAAERETNTDPSEVCMNGRSSNEVLAEEENSWAVGQECVVNGDHSLEEKEVDSTSSELMPPDGLGCQRVTPLTEISSDGASNTDINLIKKRSDKAHFRVPPDGISPPSTIISEEAMAKGANTFSLPSHDHKDTIPSRLVDPPDALSGQPSSLPNGVVSGGARSIETKAGTLPSTNQKETTPSRGFPPSGSVQSPLPSQALSGGASSDGPKSVTLPCKSDKDKGPTRAQPDGLSIQASSVTTDRAGNYVKVVALPTKNGRTQSGTTTPSGLCAQPLPVTTNAVPKGARNVASQDMSTAGHWIAGKSLSCPNDSAVAKKEERSELKRYKSELLPTPMEKKRKFKPSDPLAKTILGCLDLLEGLSRCLDKEYKYGSCKCWKHIAERFGIEEQEYQKFNCSQVHSPTEVMFEYLKAQNPEITIGDVKDGLHSIAREDVVRVLVKYEQTYDTVDNGTPVCSLFDTDPDIIGKIAFLMDVQKKGLKKWSDLASSLKVPRADFKTFETGNTEYPAAETLFKLVKIHFPRTTVGTLITHLKTIKRQDVIIAIRECTEVTEDSLLKNLMEELDVMENVCELLNQKQRTNRVKNWRHLGGLFNFEQETLDDLSPSQEENVCPTEALIQHLGGLYPDSTLEELILAIHLIDRDDALDVLDVYLEDGCIAHLLRLCDCKRCKKARGQEKGHADGL